MTDNLGDIVAGIVLVVLLSGALMLWASSDDQ